MTIEPQESADTKHGGGIPVDSFANRLMLARAYAGHLSIREAADLCDVGRGAWTNWEKGARPADVIEVATLVAEKLKVDREWLLFGGQLGQETRRSARRAINVKNPYVFLSRSDEPKSHDPLAPRPISRSGRRDPVRPSSAQGSSRRPAGSRPAVLPRPR